MAKEFQIHVVANDVGPGDACVQPSNDESAAEWSDNCLDVAACHVLATCTADGDARSAVASDAGWGEAGMHSCSTLWVSSEYASFQCRTHHISMSAILHRARRKVQSCWGRRVWRGQH